MWVFKVDEKVILLLVHQNQRRNFYIQHTVTRKNFAGFFFADRPFSPQNREFARFNFAGRPEPQN
jgi:hypothetical protein